MTAQAPVTVQTPVTEPPGKRRNNLVVVRAGDRSLHPAWLEGSGERNWDLVVNYYGDSPDLYRTSDVVRIDSKGPKWPALQELLLNHPDLVDEYDYIWLPDDDLAATKADINLLFDICATHRLAVAQPSLDWRSYFGHLTTLRNPRFALRFTNYVEVMAPCFASATLARAVPLFGANLSGWGLDFIWPKLTPNPNADIAIIDSVSVVHTRPVGGPNYNALRAKGISPWDELRQFCRQNGLDDEPEIITHAAITSAGKNWDARRAPRGFALQLAQGYLAASSATPEPRRLYRRLAGLVIKAMLGMPDRVAENSLLGGRSAERA